MVNIDERFRKVDEYREKAYNVLDDFIAQENKKGLQLYRDPDGNKGLECEVFSDSRCEDLVMDVEIGINPLDKPIVNVYRREYFAAAYKVAEKIEKEIGVLLRELYLI